MTLEPNVMRSFARKRPAMRRLLRLLPAPGAALLALLLTCLGLAALAGPALAVPGLDPNWVPAEFEVITMQKTGDGNHVEFDRLPFVRSLPGWDFGDRQGYVCAFVEYFDNNGELLFVVNFERVEGLTQANGDPYALINDKGGVEISDNPELDTLKGELCGEPEHVGATYDGSDHFPHYTQHTPDAPFQFYRNGTAFASLDLRRDECARGYWAPGNEPGEAWLWWDEDGPTNDGHSNLACGGGSDEPIAVVRAYVTDMAPGVSVCTEDSLAGDRCAESTSPSSEEHRSRVTLRLRGDIRASGYVKIPDGTAECKGDRTVRIQRRVSGHWRTVGRDQTTANGYYAAQLAPREGGYRARVLEMSLADGLICMAATSGRRVYE
ncbi:MAG: hypothetical protein ACRDHS_08755 [Actinomycetota bacterium]